MRDDFPTFERPMNAYSWRLSVGHFLKSLLLIIKRAVFIIMSQMLACICDAIAKVTKIAVILLYLLSYNRKGNAGWGVAFVFFMSVAVLLCCRCLEGFGFPTESTRSKNGCIGFLELAENDFRLSFKCRQHGTVHCLTHWAKQKFAALCKTTEEDESLGGGEYGHIGHRFAKKCAGVVEDVFGYLVALDGCVVHILRCDFLDGKIAENGWFSTYLEEFAGAACHASSGAIGLKATGTAASAETSVIALDDEVSELAGEAVVAVNDLSIDHYARSYTCAESNHNEILEATCCTIGHFTEGGGVGVVCHGYRNTELLAHELSKFHILPGKIGGVVDFAGIVVGVRCADAYALNLICGFIGFYKMACLAVELVEIIVEIGVFAGFDRGTGDYITAGVHDAENGVSTAYVDA